MKSFRITVKAGQAMLEYLLVFVVLLALLGAVGIFVRAARASSARTTELVTAEYP